MGRGESNPGGFLRFLISFSHFRFTNFPAVPAAPARLSGLPVIRATDAPMRAMEFAPIALIGASVALAIYLPCSSIIERTTFLSSSQSGSPNSMVRFTTSTSPASLTASLRKSVSSYACALSIRKSVRLSITSF